MKQQKRFGMLAAALVLALAHSLAQPLPPDEPFDWESVGANVFVANCSACHGPTGEGVPGAFPPLAGHVPEILQTDGGRELLAEIVLFGLQGPIEVAGSSYNGAMPAWHHLSDTELAAVLNHVASEWGNAEALTEETTLYSPTDIAAIRAEELTPADVHAKRSSAFGESGAGVRDEAGAEQPETAASAAVNDDTGYFTVEQAESGRELYREHCSLCHGPTMRGGLHDPPLTNLGFFREWGGRTFDSLFSFISTRMPLSNPGDLRTDQYLEIAAFWLSEHEYPAGEQPLTADPEQLRQIVIERR